MNKKHNKSYRSLKRMRQYISKTKRIQRSNKNKKSSLANGHNNKTKVVEKRRRLRHIVQRGGLPPGWTEHTDSASGRNYYFNSSTDQSSWEDPDVYKGGPPGPLDTHQPYTHSAAAAGGDVAYSATTSKKYRWVHETQPVKGQNFAAAADWDLLDYHYQDTLEQAFASKKPGIIEIGDVRFDIRDPQNMTMTYKTRNITRKIERQQQN